MGKHQRKVEAALEARKAAAPKGSGFHEPGSRNRNRNRNRKKGYAKRPKR